MKKIILTFASALLICPATFAAFLRVETVTPFSTDAPPDNIELRSLGEVQLTNDIKIEENDVIYGNLTNVKSPRRLKRDATFDFEIQTIHKENGEVKKVSENKIGSYMSLLQVNKKELAKNAALTVGNHFVKGISMGVHAVEGAVENRSDGAKAMAKGAVSEAYDCSILGYTNKGKEVALRKGENFYLKLITADDFEKEKTKAETEAPNYTFEAPAQ